MEPKIKQGCPSARCVREGFAEWSQCVVQTSVSGWAGRRKGSVGNFFWLTRKFLTSHFLAGVQRIQHGDSEAEGAPVKCAERRIVT